MFYNWVNEIWEIEHFVFYLKARKMVVQVKLGDRPKQVEDLSQLEINTSEWVQITSKLFAESCKPTLCVQRISSRLYEEDYTEVIPSNVFLEYCVQEHMELKLKTPQSSKKRSTQNLLRLFQTNLKKQSTQKPPKGFDLLNYGKKNSKPKPQEKSIIVDEELEMATAETSPQTHKEPVYYTLPSQESQEEEYQKQIEELVDERDRVKDALEETIQFCDTISYEHDMLLIQNYNIKKLLSVVTDKLIRVNPNLVKDVDFSLVLEDPCKDFKPTGILSEPKSEKSFSSLLNAKEEFLEALEDSEEVVDLPFSELAGQNIKKNHPNTPKFSLQNFKSEIYYSQVDYDPSSEGFIELRKGDKIRLISEMEDWCVGENLETGERGLFASDYVSK